MFNIKSFLFFAATVDVTEWKCQESVWKKGNWPLVGEESVAKCIILRKYDSS